MRRCSSQIDVYTTPCQTWESVRRQRGLEVFHSPLASLQITLGTSLNPNNESILGAYEQQTLTFANLWSRRYRDDKWETLSNMTMRWNIGAHLYYDLFLRREMVLINTKEIHSPKTYWDRFNRCQGKLGIMACHLYSKINWFIGTYSILI